MNKNVLYWVCQLCGFSFLTFINIFYLLSIEDSSKQDVYLTIIISAFYLILSHIYRNFIKKHNWVKLYFSQLVLRVLLATVILSFIKLLFEFGIDFILDNEQSPIQKFQLFAIFLSMTSSMTLWIGWSLIYFLFHYVVEYNKSLKWEAYATEFELNKLKSQLNPHFIFNALNSIRALVDENPKKCKDAINQLSNILRSSLMMDRQKLIPFEQELKAVKDYLALETIRFEERLRSEINIDPASFNFRVPPLMLQTLVENGIKHGISKLKEGGLIKMDSIIDQEGKLLVQIRNTGTYLNGHQSEGFGLENTRQRLKLLFGDTAEFRIFNEKENTVLTEVIIPKS